MTVTLPRVALGLLAASALIVGAVLVVATNPMPPSPAADVPPAAPIRHPFDGNRTFTVGTSGDQVTPGTYTTDGATSEGGACYWARLSGDPDDPNATIEDGYDDGRQAVTIAPSDRAFASRGCAEWQPT